MIAAVDEQGAQRPIGKLINDARSHAHETQSDQQAGRDRFG